MYGSLECLLSLATIPISVSTPTNANKMGGFSNSKPGHGNKDPTKKEIDFDSVRTLKLHQVGSSRSSLLFKLASPPRPPSPGDAGSTITRQCPQTSEVSAGTRSNQARTQEADSVFPLPDPVPAAIRKGPDLTSFQPFSPPAEAHKMGNKKEKKKTLKSK